MTLTRGLPAITEVHAQTCLNEAGRLLYIPTPDWYTGEMPGVRVGETSVPAGWLQASSQR